MKIAIGNDHAGTELKFLVIDEINKRKNKITNYGTDSKDSVDYPDFVHPVAKSVNNGDADFGILICGSGNGVCMTANKHPNVRAALCWSIEIAELARLHNNANILCIPARFVKNNIGLKIVDTFLSTRFEGGRHQKRVDKIPI